jgi:hypothetical protein
VLWVYDLFHRFDWGHPFTKLLCFATLAGLVLWLNRAPASLADGEVTGHDSSVAWIEASALAVVGAFFVGSYLRDYGSGALHAPLVDIGYTTQKAARLLFHEFANPYASELINPRAELAPEHRGFHYGPTMLLGYVASAFDSAWGLKFSSLFFLGLMLSSAGTLAWYGLDRTRNPRTPPERSADLLFVFLITLGAERFWYELLRQGATDILPVALLIMAIALRHFGHFFASGLMLGLSFSAKFAPAFVFIALLLNPRTPRALFAGMLIGVSPYLAFAVWDWRGLVENVFILRSRIPYDSTSLYSITPEELHWLFTVVPVSVALAGVWRSWRYPLDTKRWLLYGFLVLLAFEVTFKEVHANHLMWFFPLVALNLLPSRYRFFTTFQCCPCLPSAEGCPPRGSP